MTIDALLPQGPQIGSYRYCVRCQFCRRPIADTTEDTSEMGFYLPSTPDRAGIASHFDCAPPTVVYDQGYPVDDDPFAQAYRVSYQQQRSPEMAVIYTDAVLTGSNVAVERTLVAVERGNRESFDRAEACRAAFIRAQRTVFNESGARQ